VGRFPGAADPEGCLTVREVLPTEVEAEREVERLNQLANARGSDVRYWFSLTRFFPEGRGTSD